MRMKVQKWGNSLGLRIPKPFAVEMGLADDAEVDLSVADGALRTTFDTMGALWKNQTS